MPALANLLPRRPGAPVPEPARPTRRPEGVPLAPFGAAATAEEVTAGLDLAGRLVLVTGATSGIGFETARVLALRGAEVVVAGRTLAKARAACSALPGRCTPLALELTDYPGVVQAAQAVRALGRPLDVLVCNAGVMSLPRLEQVRGIEKQFATNHLGHFLLVQHLLERVQAAPQGRVVVVSSYVMSWSHPEGIEWDDLAGERCYHPARAYGQSKLANALFALALARRLQGTRASANSLEPGYVDTALFRHYWPSLRGFRGLLTRKMTVAQGAATPCWLAAAPSLAGVSGHHFAECNPVVPIDRAKDPAAAARLWEVSAGLLRPFMP